MLVGLLLFFIKIRIVSSNPLWSKNIRSIAYDSLKWCLSTLLTLICTSVIYESEKYSTECALVIKKEPVIYFSHVIVYQYLVEWLIFFIYIDLFNIIVYSFVLLEYNVFLLRTIFVVFFILFYTGFFFFFGKC